MTMTRWILLRASLRHDWRENRVTRLASGVVFACVAAALLVGHATRETMAQSARTRMGSVQFAIRSARGGLRVDRVAALEQRLRRPCAGILIRQGTLSWSGDAGARAAAVRVVGVTSGFGALFVPPWRRRPGADEILLGRGLGPAQAAKARGTDWVLRVAGQSPLPLDASLTSGAVRTKILRLRQVDDADRSQEFDFSLDSDPLAPPPVFVDLATLATAVGSSSSVDQILVGGPEGLTADTLRDLCEPAWRLEDLGLEGRSVSIPGAPGGALVNSGRIYIPEDLEGALIRAIPTTQSRFTHLADSLEGPGGTLAYPLVVGMSAGSARSLTGPGTGDMILETLAAQRLGTRAGDQVTMLSRSPDRWARPAKPSVFRVAALATLDDPRLSGEWIPRIPGLTDQVRCHDWDESLGLDPRLISVVDEEFWSRNGARPRALINLADAARLWPTPWGRTTSVFAPETSVPSLESLVRARTPLGTLGLVIDPVQQRGRRSRDQALDLGALLLATSALVILVGAGLASLSYILIVTARSDELRLLSSVGLPRSWIRSQLWMEGLTHSLGGLLPGIPLALVLGWALHSRLAPILGPAGQWPSVTISAVFQSGAVGMVIAMGTCALSLAHLLGRFSLSAQGADHRRGPGPHDPGRLRLGPLGLCILGAAGLLAAPASSLAGAPRFLSLGLLITLSGCLALDGGLRRIALAPSRVVLTTSWLILRWASARRTHSLGLVGLVASSAFLLIALESQHSGARPVGSDPGGPTGGFSLVAYSQIPLSLPLGDARGQERLGLEPSLLRGLSVSPVRVRDGDDASCLNPERAQSPRILGVEAGALERLGAFAISRGPTGSRVSPWSLLLGPGGPTEVPVLVDEATLTYGLGADLGARFQVIDDAGRSVSLVVVGTLAPSVLQGALIMDQGAFRLLFPSISGHRMWLARSPGSALSMAGHLEDRLADLGVRVQPTHEVLARYGSVQDTYLGLFQTLGLIAFILGAGGVATLAARSALDGRSERRMLEALGWGPGQAARLLVAEHSALVGLGLLLGLVAGQIALIPTLVGTSALGSRARVALGLWIWTTLWTWAAVSNGVNPVLGRASSSRNHE